MNKFLTVKQLRNILTKFDDDIPVVFPSKSNFFYNPISDPKDIIEKKAFFNSYGQAVIQGQTYDYKENIVNVICLGNRGDAK